MSDVSFDIAFDENTIGKFSSIRDAMLSDGLDPFDRDAFLMHRSVVELIHGGRPPEGLGEAIDEFAALTHLMFLYWMEGERQVELSSLELGSLVASAPSAHPPTRPSAYFAGLPRLVWGSPTDLGPEPLNGWFAARRGDDHLMIAAMFGGRPGRDGASVVAVGGPDPGELRRDDGTPAFASTLTGGAEAGLYSLTGMEELLALAWRVEHWRGGRA